MRAPSAASAYRSSARKISRRRLRQAQASGKPAIVRLAIDPEAITPAMTLAKIRAKSLAEKES